MNTADVTAPAGTTTDHTSGATAATLPPPPPQPSQQQDVPSGSITTGLILLVGGGLWLLDVLGVIEVSFALVLPALLLVIAVALLTRSFSGSQPGLIAVGVLVALACLAVAITPTGAFHGGIGQRNIPVTDQTELQARYDVGVGEIRLDLRDLELTEPAEVAVSVGAGEMIILLPPGVPVTIDASAGAGEIDLLGQSTSGLSRTLSHTTPGFETATTTLTLNLSVATGSIEVTQ